MVATIPKPKFEITPQMRRRFGVRPPLTLIEWAERHIKIIDGPLVEGGEPIPWTPDLFPLQRAPMESLTDPRWSRTVLVTAPQAFGKTQCVAIPPLLYALEYRHTSAFYMAANRELASAQWDKKIEPIMQADEALAELFYDNPDFGGTHHLRHFTNGTSLYLAGSESPGKMAGFSAPDIICDDVQAYPTSLPRFGHPADYALTRSGALPTEQCIHAHVGTAGTVDCYLCRSLTASAYYVPVVPCLKCGAYQLIDFERFVYNAEDPVSAADNTAMRCAGDECEHFIRFEELPRMLERARWVSMPPGEDWIGKPPEGLAAIDIDKARVYPATDRNTNVAGFWCSAFYWPYGKTWGEHAADWIGRRGDPDREKDFRQNILVIPYAEPEIDEERLTEEEIATHAVDGYAGGTVPEGADVVICTVDVQSGYVYYLVQAWRRADGTAWLIELGTVGRPIKGPSEQTASQRRRIGITAALDKVDEICRAGWPLVKLGSQVVGKIELTRGGVDRGFEPDIIGAWWRAKHRGVWFQIKGLKAGRKGGLWPIKPVQDKRQRLYRDVDVNQAKHIVRRLMRIGSGEPGYWHTPTSGIHPNTMRAFARHMASERFNRERQIPRWEVITPGMANHFWDCVTYQVCLAVACGVKLAGEKTRQKIVKTEHVEANKSTWRIGR